MTSKKWETNKVALRLAQLTALSYQATARGICDGAWWTLRVGKTEMKVQRNQGSERSQGSMRAHTRKKRAS